VRELNKTLPSMPVKRFTQLMFRACPMLREFAKNHEEAFERFMKYKLNVPVCGAIILNDILDKCILVKGWKTSSGWGFPKGKINQLEIKADCAIREVNEEVGFDITDYLVEDHKISMMIKDQEVTLYIVSGISEDTLFQTRTRKEISKIEWFRLVDLPTWKRNHTAPGKFYLITPFIGPLKDFVKARKTEARQRLLLEQQRQQHKAQQQQQQQENGTPAKAARKKQPQQTQESQQSEPPATPSAVDNLFSRILVSSTPSTPAPADEIEEPPLSDTPDPHMARLMQTLFTSASLTADTSSSSEPESSRSATPTDTSSSHSPAVDPSKTPRVNGIPVPSDTCRPASSMSQSSNESSSPPVTGELQRKRSMHLALLQTVDDEIARAVTPLQRPATTSPVRPLHQHPLAFAPPPPYINHHAHPSHPGPSHHLAHQPFPHHQPFAPHGPMNGHGRPPQVPLGFNPALAAMRLPPLQQFPLHAPGVLPIPPLSAGPMLNSFPQGLHGRVQPLHPGPFNGLPYLGIAPPLSAGPLSAHNNGQLRALVNQRAHLEFPPQSIGAPTGGMPARPSTAALGDLRTTPVPPTANSGPASPNLALQALNGSARRPSAALQALNGSQPNTVLQVLNGSQPNAALQMLNGSQPHSAVQSTNSPSQPNAALNALNGSTQVQPNVAAPRPANAALQALNGGGAQPSPALQALNNMLHRVPGATAGSGPAVPALASATPRPPQAATDKAMLLSLLNGSRQ